MKFPSFFNFSGARKTGILHVILPYRVPSPLYYSHYSSCYTYFLKRFHYDCFFSKKPKGCMGCGGSKSQPLLASQPKLAPNKCPPSPPTQDHPPSTPSKHSPSSLPAPAETNNNHPLPNQTAKDQEPGSETADSDLDSLEISFEKAASLRLETPAQMWAAVRKTCSPSKKWTIEKNKSRRGWKTIRLFVSSTFKDFHVEREVLVKEVFPDLRLWCEQRKLHLVECDLRWGVPKDSTSEETIRICLEVLDRCHEENVLPYFLNLTCERAGWIPTFGDLTYNLAAQYGWVYGLSVTEMEIVHGAFRKCNPNALFLIRDGEFASKLPKDVKEAFVDADSFAQKKLVKLKQVICEQFPEPNIHHYQVECSDEQVEGMTERDVKLKGLSGQGSFFYKTVYEFFKTRIEEQYPLDPTPEDPLEAQRTAHESFLDIRSQCVLGRDGVLAKIEEYIRSNPRNAPLLLVGNAGSGKSAIMAKSAHDAVEKSHNSTEINFPRQMLKWKVYFHFVGATPGSTDLAFFLQRLTKELNPRKTDVVSDLDSLVQLANSLLSNPNTPPTIVFVDAINQMDSDKLQYLTRWLPEVVSPNVRIVLSMIDETDCHRLLRAYKTNPTEIVVGELDYDSRKAIVVNNLSRYNKRLDDEQMKLLLSKKGSANPLWLSLACEELRVYGVFRMVNDKIQSLSDDLLSLEEQVLTRFEEENGGQLVIATVCLLETSRHGLLETELLELLADESNLTPPEYKAGDDEVCSTKAENSSQGAGMSDATEALADKLQEQVNIAYVQTAESKDEAKKKEEAEEASSSQKRRRIHLPAVKWAIVYRALKPLLRPCGDLGEGRLDFYHRSISKAVRRKYFSGDEAYKKHMYTFWHGRLAEFFEHCEDFDRKSEELPYHLEQLLDNNRLTRCLLEWPVFERLFSEDFSVDLLRSWQKAGGYAAASNLYRESLNILESSGASAAEVAERKFMVITFLIQAGQYKESLELLEELRKIEEEQMGARTEKMAEIYQLMSKTKSEIVKNYNFVTKNQLKEDQEIVRFCEKCISYREKLSGDENEVTVKIECFLTALTFICRQNGINTSHTTMYLFLISCDVIIPVASSRNRDTV
ncbi:telomerase protein component 1-like isoform X3 [Dendronephthya gigantea]|uniref:telomerase protein component 1-like isoform X3 n=1 Tax=Dendronephthya gigantea TaxID=151771 RepID=UPI001069DB36|nr:telomerase protein component 1-like isoform X3 [Dendronephthya gigantea]